MKILITGITDSGILRVRTEMINAFLREGHLVTVVSPMTKSTPPMPIPSLNN